MADSRNRLRSGPFNFLTTWQAWRADPQRPRLLHFVSIEAYPVSRDDLLRAAAAYPELAALAAELARAVAWPAAGLSPPGLRRRPRAAHAVHRRRAADAARQQRFEADSIFLDGFSPERNPADVVARDAQGRDALCAARHAHRDLDHRAAGARRAGAIRLPAAQGAGPAAQARLPAGRVRAGLADPAPRAAARARSRRRAAAR